jgi:hypothetical protein
VTQSNIAEDLNVEKIRCENNKSLNIDQLTEKEKLSLVKVTSRSQLQTNGQISKDYHKCVSFGAVSNPSNRRVTRRWRS